MNKYLERYVEAAKIIYIDEAVAIQDMEFCHVYHTQNYLKLAGLNESLIGKKYSDINSTKISNYAKKMLAVSEYVNRTGSKARYVSSSLIEGDANSCYLVEESLILDPANNEKAGRILKIAPLDVSLIWQVLRTTNNFKPDRRKVAGSNYPQEISNPQNSQQYPNLTEREREILFLMIIGEKYKSIANILSTVYEKDVKETAIKNLVHRQLFEKFNVYNSDALIETVIHNNLIIEIPDGLLKLLDGILNVQIVPQKNYDLEQ